MDISNSIVDYAETIKHENYKVNTPTKFQINKHHSADSEKFVEDLGEVINIDKNNLDYVFFSVCKGAEPHTDALDPEKFTGTTYVIPLILPKGISTITASGQTEEVELFNVYEFDHTKLHQMDLEDNDSGCVVMMVGELTEKGCRDKRFEKALKNAPNREDIDFSDIPELTDEDFKVGIKCKENDTFEENK
jgi:hypothetical protein